MAEYGEEEAALWDWYWSGYVAMRVVDAMRVVVGVGERKLKKMGALKKD